MLHRTIFGTFVWFTDQQEASLRFAEKVSKELEQQRISKEEQLLQDALRRMESRDTRYPMAEKFRKQLHKNFLESCKPKRHAWEYTDFDFFFEGKEYHYSNGDIVLKEEIEILDFDSAF